MIFESPRVSGKLEFYFESGPRGEWVLEPDPMRFYFSNPKKQTERFWIGRAHPLAPSIDDPIEPTSAIGSIWSQNQIDALNPRVTGWVGAGRAISLGSGWQILMTYSPLFIPTIGPTFGFTERGDLRPARFARLPPAEVETSGVRVPIRYQLKLDQMKELVFNHQGFFGVGIRTEGLTADVFASTAPKPVPVPRTDAVLGIEQETVKARVAIHPQFPREYWAGFRARLNRFFFEPSFEFVQNLREQSNRSASLTLSLPHPLPRHLRSRFTVRPNLGILSQFQKRIAEPEFSDLLVFLRIPFAITEKLVLKTLIQSTLWHERRSIHWLQELEYSPTPAFSMNLGVRVLAGGERSYFGEWRNHSSVMAGVRLSW